jgi:hypothetical protein
MIRASKKSEITDCDKFRDITINDRICFLNSTLKRTMNKHLMYCPQVGLKVDTGFTSFYGHSIIGDSVASTIHNSLSFTLTKVRYQYPSELGRLRYTLQTWEKF